MISLADRSLNTALALLRPLVSLPVSQHGFIPVFPSVILIISTVSNCAISVSPYISSKLRTLIILASSSYPTSELLSPVRARFSFSPFGPPFPIPDQDPLGIPTPNELLTLATI